MTASELGEKSSARMSKDAAISLACRIYICGATAAAVLPLTEGRKVDARALHGWLGIGRVFSSWFRALVAEYGFEEGADYAPVSVHIAGKRGKPRKDYLLTLDAAKQIALIVNTPRGRATRLYFIAAEKAAVKMAGGDTAL